MTSNHSFTKLEINKSNANTPLKMAPPTDNDILIWNLSGFRFRKNQVRIDLKKPNWSDKLTHNLVNYDISPFLLYISLPEIR